MLFRSKKGRPTAIRGTYGTYVDIVGNPPHPGTMAFHTWKDRYIDYRYRIVKRPRAVKVYISAEDGNDSIFDNQNSISTPFATWERAKLYAANSSVSNNALNALGVEYSFKRGEEHIITGGVTDGISLSGSLHYSFTAYGDSLLRPRIHKWSSVTGTWTNTSGNVWKLTGISTAPGWIIEDDGTDEKILNPFALTNSSGISTTSRSWYYSSGTQEVYINMGGTNPNFASLRWVPDGANNNTDGIYAANAGDIYISGLRIEAYGARAYASSTGYGIETRQGGDFGAVVEDCECYYNGNHNIGHISDPSGGFVIHKDCIAGHDGILSGGGHTTYVGYASQGGLEYVNTNCRVRFGGVPSTTFTQRMPGKTDVNINSVYAHTGGDSFQNSLYIWENLQCEDNTASFPNSTKAQLKVSYDDHQMVGDDSDITTLRAFVINSSQDNMPVGVLRCMTKCVWINCKWTNATMTDELSSGALFGTINNDIGNGGWWINCTMQVSDLVGRSNSCFPTGASVPTYPKIINSQFEFDSAGTTQSWTFIGSANSTNAIMYNSIVSEIASAALRGFNFNMPNNSTALKNNAYFGTPLSSWNSQFSGDTGAVSLVSKPTVGATPASGYDNEGILNPGGFTLEYDAEMNPRTTTTAIGPLEI